uniref:sugar transporter SWEET1 isoform X2 n=1 Tax=Vespula vulgaris TaxID=7454 RepID=UPI00223BA414|nr:sugar transporter SWEET1 isoform X2 [Vespula vulgaris]
MVSTEIKDILATSASICTILQFLAGVLVCRKYIKNGTTGDSSSLAFITCYMSCSLWLRYGLLIGDSFVVLVNIFGTILQTHVLRIKNTESLPFPVILASLIVSCQWFAYGCLINDQFIQMPNFMGCILSAFQLSLFCLYPNKRVDQTLLI